MEILRYIKLQMDLHNVPTWLKKVFASLLLFTATYFAPAFTKGVSILIFILVDTITGVWAARIREEDIDIGKLRKAISKTIAYTVALFVAVIFTKEFGLDILTIVAFGLASIELKSIFKHLYVITDVDIIKWIHNSIKSRHDAISNSNSEDEK